MLAAMSSTLPTLILSPRRTRDIDALEQAATSAGWRTRRLASWSPPLDLRGTRVAVYGEPLLCALLAQELDLRLIEPTFDWLARLPHAWLQRDMAFTTLGQARETTEQRFVKRCDDKCFVARVYEPGEVTDLPETIGDSTPVLVSEPVVWDSEFRAFVLEGRITTMSTYAERGELVLRAVSDGGSRARDAVEFVERFLGSGITLPPACALDVGQIEGRGWAVVEANTAWGSGIYACDPERVLEVLCRACRLPSEQETCDSPWIVERGSA